MGNPVNMPDTTLDILTLGRFSISVEGRAVAIDWPSEMMKVFFCSLLSPLDLYFSWERIGRSMSNESTTPTGKRQLEEIILQPLKSVLVRELGFYPLIIVPDGIKVDRQRVHVDAFEFYSSVVEGLVQLSFANHAAALEKFRRADFLYAGSYLPGMSGTIITSTRVFLENLYKTAVMEAVRQKNERYPELRNNAPGNVMNQT